MLLCNGMLNFESVEQPCCHISYCAQQRRDNGQLSRHRGVSPRRQISAKRNKPPEAVTGTNKFSSALLLKQVGGRAGEALRSLSLSSCIMRDLHGRLLTTGSMRSDRPRRKSAEQAVMKYPTPVRMLSLKLCCPPSKPPRSGTMLWGLLQAHGALRDAYVGGHLPNDSSSPAATVP